MHKQSNDCFGRLCILLVDFETTRNGKCKIRNATLCVPPVSKRGVLHFIRSIRIRIAYDSHIDYLQNNINVPTSLTGKNESVARDAGTRTYMKFTAYFLGPRATAEFVSQIKYRSLEMQSPEIY